MIHLGTGPHLGAIDATLALCGERVHPPVRPIPDALHRELEQDEDRLQVRTGLAARGDDRDV